jgi:hypothetical protein
MVLGTWFWVLGKKRESGFVLRASGKKIVRNSGFRLQKEKIWQSAVANEENQVQSVKCEA